MEDILLNTTHDLDIANGDLPIGESTLQNQDLLLMTNKGEWKENPTIAVGAAGFLKDEEEAGLMAEIKTQFEKDGMKVKQIEITEEKLNIDANY
jgi:hypothetical protein